MQFVREEVEPLDYLFPHLQFVPLDETRRKIIDPLKDEVRRQGLWATHLGPELGGQGFGQLKLALLNEILGRSQWASIVFGMPGARHRQRRDHRPLRHAGAEGALPAAAARRRAVLVLLDDRAARRRRPDACSRPARSRTATSG